MRTRICTTQASMKPSLCHMALFSYVGPACKTLAKAKWIVENLDGNIPQGLTSPLNIKYKQEGFSCYAPRHATLCHAMPWSA